MLVDDLAGKAQGMVVLGDQLPLQVLCELIAAHPDPQRALAALPAGLANRLATGPDAVERSGPPAQEEQHL